MHHTADIPSSVLSLKGFIHPGLNLIEGIEEPMRRDGRAHQRESEHIPAKHVPPRSVRTVDFHLDGFCLQFSGDSGHPDERIDEGRRDPEKIGHPVPLGPAAEYLVQFILQAAQRHIQQEEQAGREKVDEAEPESGPVCMLESQGYESYSPYSQPIFSA